MQQDGRFSRLTYLSYFAVALLAAKALRLIAGKRPAPWKDGFRDNQPRHTGRRLRITALILIADLLAVPLILRNKKDLSAAELDQVNPAAVPLPDRAALHLDFAQKDVYKDQSDNLLRVIIASALLLFLAKRLRKDAAAILLQYARTHAVTYAIYSFSPLGPAFRDKYRPVVYYNDEPHKDRDLGNNRNSGYSGHTGNAACASFFMAKTLDDYHPGWPVQTRRCLYAAALLPPLLLGFLRMKALKHFPSDVALAIVIGASSGVALPAKRK